MSTRSKSKAKRSTTARDTTVPTPERCPKRMRSSDPDVKIIVGNETFLHYSILLSNASEYFDALLSSDFKEGTTKTIEWPEKLPEEWSMVYGFIGDPASATLDDDNVEILVPWFTELRMTGWLKKADQILRAAIARKTAEFERLRQSFQYHFISKEDKRSGLELNRYALSKLEFSLLYNLTASSNQGAVLLAGIVRAAFKLFNNDPESIDRLVGILKDERVQKDLILFIQAHLPTNTPPGIDGNDLANNPLLAPLLLLKAQSLSRTYDLDSDGSDASDSNNEDDQVEDGEARP